MFLILKPTYKISKVQDISIDFFKKIGTKGIIIDVDDTLCTRDSQKPSEEVKNWLKNLKKNKIQVVLASNGMPARVKHFAKKIGLQIVAPALKPLPFGLQKAIKIMKISKKEVVLIGDQIFTDVLAANLFGIKSILIEPLSLNHSPIKRYFERYFR